MKIAVGSDHAGYPLKIALLDTLKAKGHEIEDFGSFDPNPVDFPDIAKLVCNAVLTGSAERGIMFCGTGVGASIACNKVPGIRASVCHDIYTAHQCVEHDNVQIIAMGAQIIGPTVAEELIVFDGRVFHQRRIPKKSTKACPYGWKCRLIEKK